MDSLDLKKLISLIGFESDLLNVYLTGSRVFGTHKPDSDYDLKIVVKNSYLGNITSNFAKL
jgi:predicted nucleotidyltransferase